MSPMLDFSDTTVWIVGAFISGLVVYGLVRAMFGNAAHRAAEVFSLMSHLDAAKERLEALNAEVPVLRSNSESHAAKATYYEKQFNDLFANWRTLSQDAGDVSNIKNDLNAAKKEIESLQSAVKEQASKNENTLQVKYESEIANLTSELKAAQNAGGQASWLTGEVRRLTNEMSYAARDLQASIEEKGKVEAEVTRLKAALSSAYADLRSTLMELQATKRNLQQLQDNREETSVLAQGNYRQGILDSRVCNLG
jgi:chromosome segregation ATPase